LRARKQLERFSPRAPVPDTYIVRLGPLILPHSLYGTTMIVALWGRTPPCSSAYLRCFSIVRIGMPRVVGHKVITILAAQIVCGLPLLLLVAGKSAGFQSL
jgi:hypothetical protein